MLGIGRGIARPRDLVGLGEGDGFGEAGRGLVGHGEMMPQDSILGFASESWA
jgi:hypothetical protein